MVSKCGRLARHGAHQVAQKSSTTGFPTWSDILNVLPSRVRTANDGAAWPPSPALAGTGATASDAERSRNEAPRRAYRERMVWMNLQRRPGGTGTGIGTAER